MKDRSDLLLTLLHGLDVGERRVVLDQISSAREEQLEHHRHPPRRRCRDASGALVWSADVPGGAR
jgi:hypothetical protein